MLPAERLEGDIRVGFIGLGTMGRNVAANIARAGFELLVHDIQRGVAAPLEEMRATWVDSPREMIDQADLVGTTVFGPREIEQVERDENGPSAATAARSSGSTSRRRHPGRCASSPVSSRRRVVGRSMRR